MVSYISSALGFLNYNGYAKAVLHLADFSGSFYLTRGAGKDYSDEITKTVTDVLDAAYAENPQSPFEKVDSKVQANLRKLIAPFLEQHDSNQVEFIIKKAGNLASPYGSIGTFGNNGRPIIWIAPGEHEKLVKLDKLPNSALYAVPHELGHIVNGDYGCVGRRNAHIVEISKVAVFIISTMGFSLSGYGFASSALAGALVKYVCANKVSTWVTNFLQRQNERNADLFAAKDPETCKAALEFLGAERLKNIKVLHELTDSIADKGSVVKWIASRYIGIDAYGNNINDASHPSITERIALFKTALSNHMNRALVSYLY